MLGAFDSAVKFNQDLSSWDVSSVTNMRYLFNNAPLFNSNIGSWDVSKVRDMGFLLTVATAFHQDLRSWDVSSVTDMVSIFDGATSMTFDFCWDLQTTADPPSYLHAGPLNSVYSSENDWCICDVDADFLAYFPGPGGSCVVSLMPTDDPTVALFNREDIISALQNQRYCDLIVVGGLSDSDGNGYADSEVFYFSPGLVTNFVESELPLAINAAVQYLLKSGIAQNLRDTWATGLCSLEAESEDEGITSVEFKQLLGPFAVHFCVGCAILVYSIGRHFVIKYSLDIKYFNVNILGFSDPRDDNSDKNEGEGNAAEKTSNSDKMLRELSLKLSDLHEEFQSAVRDMDEQATSVQPFGNNENSDGQGGNNSNPRATHFAVNALVRLNNKRSKPKKKRHGRFDMNTFRGVPSMHVLK